MEFIGWLGVAFGLLVGPPQLYKIIKTAQSINITVNGAILTLMERHRWRLK